MQGKRFPNSLPYWKCYFLLETPLPIRNPTQLWSVAPKSYGELTGFNWVVHTGRMAYQKLLIREVGIFRNPKETQKYKCESTIF